MASEPRVVETPDQQPGANALYQNDEEAYSVYGGTVVGEAVYESSVTVTGPFSTTSPASIAGPIDMTSNGEGIAVATNTLYADTLTRAVAHVTVAAGAATIRFEVGVASTTDVGSNIYRVNFDNDFDDANYPCICSASTGGGGAMCSQTNRKAHSVDIKMFTDSGVLSDIDFSIVCYGTQN